MEDKGAGRPTHREWRRLAKKERRRRVRRKNAQERDADAERLRATLERSANYTNWLAEQEKLEKEREIVEQREHDEKEKLWLEEEVRSQKEWRIQQERKAKARQAQILQEELIRKEFEAKQEVLRMKKEETKRRYEEEAKRHEDIRKKIDDYIDEGASTPETMRIVTESQSGKELCPFFTKTGACRYGESCSRNHRRVALSKVILVPGFYNHFSMEKNSAEYDTDVTLEFESSEMRNHFREFYDEVVPELETFGRIETLKYCCNSEIHLRGNLYVEYRTEREAARAWRKLKGRWWSGRQLNCEFVNLKSWRDAVCGMSKCPKGRTCNFLHTLRNPGDEYGIKSPPRWARKKQSQRENSSRRSEHRSTPKWDDVDRESTDEIRNWRWSESPEPESNLRADNDDNRRGVDERVRRRRSSKSERRRENESEHSSSRSSMSDVDYHRRKNSTSRARRKNDEERSSRRSSEKMEKRRRKHETSDCEEIERKNLNVEASESTKKSHRSDEGPTDETSRVKSRMEKDESDENVDRNSKKNRRRVKKLQTRDEERIDRIRSKKPRWDDIEKDADHEHDDRRRSRNLTSTEEAETMEKRTKQKPSTRENISITMGSENKEKLREPSP